MGDPVPSNGLVGKANKEKIFVCSLDNDLLMGDSVLPFYLRKLI